jgi:multidrug efflux pump subunit AcrB
MITQVLNFGLPAPIDVQINGADVNANRAVANRILDQIRAVPGIVDARIQQNFDYPDFEVNVDRTKAQQNGLTERDVATSVLDTLSGSFQTAPMFFLNQQNGVSYNLAAEAPQYDIQSLRDLQTIPVTGPAEKAPAILADLATIRRSQEMASVDHYNIRRVVDVYANVQGRDLGPAGRDVTRIVDANRHLLPRGSFVTIRGQLETMRGAYVNLLTGLGFSIVLVYLLIVVNFQSWLDPFIIITALPAALAGIVLFLFLTHTTLSVPALMGAIMCMGVATSNSILVVSFAKERLLHHGDSFMAAIEAGTTRFRPVIMTALAMIIGMIPMALGLGDGGEQNAPLGRAVIGGLLCATVATLVFVPSVFALLHGRSTSADEEPVRKSDSEPIHA